MTSLDYRNAVSIFEVAFYSPALLIAIFLCFKHGFGRSSGWFFLIIFSIARVIGGAMELATISAPTNFSLYEGSAILQNIGLSPLLLCSLGIVSRVVSDINLKKMTPIDPRMLRLIQLITTVGLILGIVGGVNAGNDFSSTGLYKSQTESKVGVILFLVSWMAITGATIVLLFSISAAAISERRLLIAVALSIPFLLVRVLYSILSNYSSPTSKFNSLEGSTTILLVMALIMEAIVVVFYETVGIMAEKHQPVAVAVGRREGEQLTENNFGKPIHKQEGATQRSQANGQNNAFLKIAKKTIIGRIIMRFTGDSRSNRDLEMQAGRQ